MACCTAPGARSGSVWVAEPGSDADSVDLAAWLEPRLARYKIPRHFLRWDELPKSAYGKVVKRSIREHLVAQRFTTETPAQVSV